MHGARLLFHQAERFCFSSTSVSILRFEYSHTTRLYWKNMMLRYGLLCLLLCGCSARHKMTISAKVDNLPTPRIAGLLTYEGNW
jgi:hypothetical protein